MRRSRFLAGIAALSLPALGGRRAFAALEGSVTTQRELFAALPRPSAHAWTRVILGSGAVYQKQIGAGIELAADGRKRYYYELQTGSPGGSCNPSTMRKAYLRDAAFGSLLDTYPLLANIGRTENLVYRYGDLAGDSGRSNPADSHLRLLDDAYLYDPRPVRIVSVGTQRIHVASTTFDAVHVVAEFSKGRAESERLKHVELWHDPRFPFGLAKYRATLAELEPFEMHVYSHGNDFKSLLSLSLDEVRAMTKDGAYGQLPYGVGA